MEQPSLPTIKDLCEPLLRAMQVLGGSATNKETEKAVSADLRLSDEQLSIPAGKGQRAHIPKFSHRLAFARSWLKMAGYLENSQRGTWTITPSGREALLMGIDVAIIQEKIARRGNKEQPSISPPLAEDADIEYESPPTAPDLDEFLRINQENCHNQLIERMNNISPGAFEDLCCLILRESGLTDVVRTGKPGDGGIDGRGIILVNGLVGFKIAFQCKRYQTAIGAPEIRNFRGAIEGQTDKGLFISTSYFTPAANNEAIKPGATQIDLMDGQSLAGKMCELSLGVQTKTHQIVEFDQNWFSDHGFEAE